MSHNIQFLLNIIHKMAKLQKEQISICQRLRDSGWEEKDVTVKGVAHWRSLDDTIVLYLDCGGGYTNRHMG